MPAFAIGAIALTVGTAIGWFVQYALISVAHNDWEALPAWKKRNLSATGAIVALVVGLYILWQAPSYRPNDLVWRLLMFQTIAALGGSGTLDVVLRLVTKGFR